MVTLCACESVSGPTKPLPATPANPLPATSGDIVLMTAANHLERLSIATGSSVWDIPLGGEAQLPFTHHVIALTPDQRRLAALVRGPQSEVVIAEVQSGAVVSRRVLPSGVTYQGLDVGPRSGRVYVFGIRETGPSRGPTKGPPAEALVSVLAPDLASLVAVATVRPSAGFNWSVYQAEVDPSEFHVLMSYHGPDTTGVDMLTLDGDRLVQPCAQAGIGCIESHGGFVLRRERVFLATGGARIIEADATGQTLRVIETGIENEHLMEFALDSTGSKLFFAGSCKYSRGLFVVDLATSKTMALAKQRSQTCGERILVAGESRLVIFDPDILFVDAVTGHVDFHQSAGLDPPIDGLVLAA